VRAVVLPSIQDEAKRGVYLIGQKAMEHEFEDEGLSWTGGTAPEDDALPEPQDFSAIVPDPSIGVVVYAFQMRINYVQLAKAYNYLSSNPGCRLVLTNDDQSFLLPSGGYAPGEGAIASVLYGALPAGAPEKVVVGKPHKPLLDIVQRECVPLSLSPLPLLLSRGVEADFMSAHLQAPVRLEAHRLHRRPPRDGRPLCKARRHRLGPRLDRHLQARGASSSLPAPIPR